MCAVKDLTVIHVLHTKQMPHEYHFEWVLWEIQKKTAEKSITSTTTSLPAKRVAALKLFFLMNVRQIK
jgi:hypothetical protein